MGKLFLLMALLFLSLQSITANTEDIESEGILEWVYWNTFSQTYLKTSNFWEAESAALEAEKQVKEIINAEDWLSEIQEGKSLKSSREK